MTQQNNGGIGLRGLGALLLTGALGYSLLTGGSCESQSRGAGSYFRCDQKVEQPYRQSGQQDSEIRTWINYGPDVYSRNGNAQKDYFHR